MNTIGVRELRQRASEYLRRVEAGESFEVTARGRPVARLVPIRRGGLAQLIAEGRVRLAKGDLLAHEPMPAKPGRPLPSEVLAQMREHGR